MRKATLSELNVVRKMIKHHIDNITVLRSEMEEQAEIYKKKVDAGITAKLQGLKINDLRKLLHDMYTDHYIDCEDNSWKLGFSRKPPHVLEREIRDRKRDELRKIFNTLPRIEMQIIRKEPVDLDAIINRVDAIVKGTTP